jgi:hypothetical protein
MQNPRNKNPLAFKEQTRSQILSGARAMVDINAPLCSSQVEIIAEYMVVNNAAMSMPQAKAQVKFWARKCAKN